MALEASPKVKQHLAPSEQAGGLCCLLVIVQQHRKNISPEDLRFLGGPRRREDSGGAPTREFGPILPSDEADMCRFPGLKKILRLVRTDPSLSTWCVMTSAM